MRLYFDFETVDPELLDRGSCYIWNPDFTILGMGYAIDDGPILYTRDLEEIKDIVNKADTLIAQNIVYELGCLKWLGVDFKNKKLICTRIASILDYNIRKSHSLAYLSKSILKEEKSHEKLGKWVLDNGHVTLPQKYYKTDDEEYKTKTERVYLQKATKWAYGNLAIVDPALVEEYCKHDVYLTRKLEQHFIEKNKSDGNYMKNLHMWSDMSKITTEMRHKGVRVDTVKAKKVWNYLDNKLKIIENIAKEKGWWCNYGSIKELPELMINLGIQLPTTTKGNPTCTERVLKQMEHPVAKIILDWRKYRKARDDFVGMLLDTQVNGRIHGEMLIFGAKATGRFSHKNPNLGQIPSRDKELGPMIRSLFIPEEDTQWISADYSAQEPRLYVDTAVKCQKVKPKYKRQVYNRIKRTWEWDNAYYTFDCPMVLDLQKKYQEDPYLDSHEYNRKLIEETTGIKLSRKETKTFALGKAYEKGVKSIAADLGITYEEALEFYIAFNDAAPYISMGSDYAKWLFHKRNFILTINGRKNYNEGISYRAYNYRIQGSAADQMGAALLNIYYKLDVVPMTVVHDEANFSGDKQLATKIKYEMEHAIELEVPSVADTSIADNWAEAKE